MAKSFCSLLINAKHAKAANFNVANMSINAIREHKILAKISESTVLQFGIILKALLFFAGGEFCYLLITFTERRS